ncbi:MAG: hypothetical protein J6T10_01440 [Methanobrevibacter sp.]|nr:hypothetical protein [Methanobrevibacter sp.]
MSSIDIVARLKDEFNLIPTNSKFQLAFNGFNYCDKYFQATVLYPSCISNLVHVATSCHVNVNGKLICGTFKEVNYTQAFTYLTDLLNEANKAFTQYKETLIKKRLDRLESDFC